MQNAKQVRQDLITGTENLMRRQDRERYKTEADLDKVVVDTTAAKDILVTPKWDKFENNHFAMRRRLVYIFLKVSSTLICRIRAGKRLTKMKAWIQANNIRNREDMRIKVQEDFKRAQNSRQSTEDDGEDNIFKIKYIFKFGDICIKDAMMKLPLMYEANMSSFLEKIEANPPTNFDDMVPFEALEQLEFESEFYKECAIPQMSLYDPPFRDQRKKPGCDYESVIRSRAGEPDLEKIQKAAHEQMEMLKQDKKDIVSGAIVKMPQSFLKPFDYSTELLLRPE